MIEIKHLKKCFGDLTVLKDVNATIRDGEIISIIGPSGTGKSTLLRCLNLLEKPTGGEILVDGVNLLDPATDISAIRMKMGMVFQQFNLFPHLTVLENITVSPRQLLKQSKRDAEENAMNLLKMVGLESKAYALPAELSGGQQQRVAIARALAMNPRVILFDEPTSALDPTMVDEVLSVITKLAETGITILIVTHEMRFAKNISSRVFYVDEGVIYEDGSPDQVFEHPLKPRTAAFVKRIDMECFQLDRDDFDVAHIQARAVALAQRYQFTDAERIKCREVVLTILNHIVFKHSKMVSLRLGVFKETREIGFGVVWNGPAINPLEHPTEEVKQILTKFKRVEFDQDEAGCPRLRFLFI